MHGYSNCMGITTWARLRYKGVTLRFVVLFENPLLSGIAGYYPVLPELTISKNLWNFQRIPAIHGIGHAIDIYPPNCVLSMLFILLL
eukprot:1366247-Amorphochlora_amoeboformis.AAC.1